MNTCPAVVRLLLLVLAAAITVPSFAADGGIYRSRDAQGNVIFSDRKDEASEPVRLPPTNTVPEVSTPATSPDPARDQDVPATPAYETLAITAPLDGETIVHPIGYVAVTVAVEPPLQARHSLRLLLDGEPAGIPQHGSLELSGLTRGEHTLHLLVVDDDGAVVQESAAVTVTVERPGRQPAARRRPVRPPID